MNDLLLFDDKKPILECLRKVVKRNRRYIEAKRIKNV